MYTNLSINPDMSTLSSNNTLEYVVSHNELHNFAIQISRGMRHLEEKQITHRYIHILTRFHITILQAHHIILNSIDRFT